MKKISCCGFQRYTISFFLSYLFLLAHMFFYSFLRNYLGVDYGPYKQGESYSHYTIVIYATYNLFVLLFFLFLVCATHIGCSWTQKSGESSSVECFLCLFCIIQFIVPMCYFGFFVFSIVDFFRKLFGTSDARIADILIMNLYCLAGAGISGLQCFHLIKMRGEYRVVTTEVPSTE